MAHGTTPINSWRLSPSCRLPKEKEEEEYALLLNKLKY